MLRTRVILSIAVIWYLTALVMLAQPSAFRFSNISLDNGLLSNTVYSIVQDDAGFMWFGTANGLNMFDGYKLKAFQHDPLDSNSICNSVISELFYDSKGRLWIGTYNGLTRYNYEKQKFINVRLGDPGKVKIITSIAEQVTESGCVLWIGTTDEGLYKYIPETGEQSNYRNDKDFENSISANTVIDVCVGINGFIWIAAGKHGLDKYEPDTDTFTNYSHDVNNIKSISSNHIIDILEDYENNRQILWLGTGDGGLNKFYPDSEEFIRIESPSRIISMIKNKDKLWLVTAGKGLYWYDIINHETYGLPQESASDINVNDCLIKKIYMSNDSDVWLASDESGVLHYSPAKNYFRHITASERNKGLTTSSVSGITKSTAGKVWIANTGFDIYDPQSGKINRFELPSILQASIKNLHALTMCQSEFDDRIYWFSYHNYGVIKYNMSNGSGRIFKPFNNPGSVSSDVITIILEDKRGDTWLASQSGALDKIERNTNRIIKYTHDETDTNTLSSGFILNMLEGNDSSIWVGTYKGLNLYNRIEDNFDRVSINNLPGLGRELGIITMCESIHEDDVLWFAAIDMGLFRLNTKTYAAQEYTTSDGLCNNNIMGILEDNSGNLWLSTNKGLSKFNPKTEKFINFYKNDGLLSDEFNLFSYCKDNLGNMYFGGPGGLNIFNPDSVREDTSSSKVILTDLLLFNRKVPVADSTILPDALNYLDKLVLNYTDYVFTINFTAPSFHNPDKLQYAYKLDGFNDDWIFTSSENRSATFTNIPPGDYEFRLKVSNSMGNFNDENKSLIIEILPPFWKTWWAYTFYFLFFVSSLWIFIRYRSYKLIKEKKYLQSAVDERTEELKKLNADKDRFFSIVAHDIKSPLVALVKFTEIFRKQFPKLSEDEKIESVDEIHKTLNNSYRYLTNLLNWSRIQIGRFEFNPTSIDLNELVAKNIQYTELIAASKNIKINSHAGNNYSVYADYEMISIVLRNLLSNAVKFTQKNGKIEVSVFEENNHVVVEVEDSGIGMNKEQIKSLFNIDTIAKSRGTDNEEGTGLGLILCRELINKNKGEINLHSTSDKGSKFYFTIPKTNLRD